MRSSARSSRKLRGLSAETEQQARLMAHAEYDAIAAAEDALRDGECGTAYSLVIAAAINAGGSRALGLDKDSFLIDVVRDVAHQCIVSRRKK
jgi:hypothetical protein